MKRPRMQKVQMQEEQRQAQQQDAINDIDWVCEILSHCTTLTDYYAE